MSNNSDILGPFVLEPIFKERIWGASTLPKPYPQPEVGKPIGEVWLTAEECIVDGKGKTLGKLATKEPQKLRAEHGFPLLLKMLLPKEKLSVQVHPNDAEAKLLGQQRGKTECWYVLEAEPGATVAVGLKVAMSADEMKAAIADGSMESRMEMIPVKAGDMVFVDAGTVHAIGPGMVVLETQQYSDVTYRLFDYGRPRELHVEQGVGVTKMSKAAGLVKPVAMGDFTRLVSSDYFVVDRFEIGAGASVSLGSASSLQILVALCNGCAVTADGVSMELPEGQAVVLPAEGVKYDVVGDAGATVMRILEP